jgi:Spy/CpxP family protein refolding chaperone
MKLFNASLRTIIVRRTKKPQEERMFSRSFISLKTMAVLQALLFASCVLSTIAAPAASGSKSTPIAAVHEKKGAAFGCRGEHQLIFSQLKLSPKQTEAIQAIGQEGRQKSEGLKNQLRTKRHALMQYLHTNNAALSPALALNNEVNQIQQQIGELRLKTFFAMRSQLTPEQLQQFQKLKARFPQSGRPGKAGPGSSCGARNSSHKLQERPESEAMAPRL